MKSSVILGIISAIIILSGSLMIIFLVPDFESFTITLTEISVKRQNPDYVNENEFLKSNNKIFQDYIDSLENEKENISKQLDEEQNEILYYEIDVLQTAGNFLKQGSYEEAIDLYNILLERNPDDSSILHLKGMALGSMGKHEEALTYFDKSIQSKEPRLFEWMKALAYSSKSLSLFELERYDEAIENIDEAIKIIPINANFLTIKASMLGSLQNHEDALYYFNKVLELYPSHVEALIGKGVALSYLDRENESIFYYNKALEINPDNEIAKKNKEIAIENLK